MPDDSLRVTPTSLVSPGESWLDNASTRSEAERPPYTCRRRRYALGLAEAVVRARRGPTEMRDGPGRHAIIARPEDGGTSGVLRRREKRATSVTRYDRARTLL